MFSSLASLIFGSNTSATTNSEENNHQPNGGEEGQNQEFNDQRENLTRIDEANTINVTSSTPSVTGTRSINDTATTTAVRQVGKRNNSNNNNNRRNKNNRQRRQAQLQQQQQQAKSTPSLAKLLTPNESSDEDLDENDWFIVEKEDEENSSLPRTDSEEELSVVEVKGNQSIVPASQQQQQHQQQRHRRQHINSHSLYSGPRPQQQRNLLQRARNSNAARNAASLSVSTLSSPLRDVAAAAGQSGSGSSDEAVSRNNSLALADAEFISQSLYVTAPIAIQSGGNDLLGANIAMEESWFVTPPPCFTSIGPIHMETSPYENLLIEHPSMSVYHSIRSAQEAAESFVNLDLGISGGNNVVVVGGGGNGNRGGDDQRPRRRPVVAATVSVASATETAIAVRPDQTAAQPQTTRATSARADRFTATQMKQELFARSTQKSHEKKERQYLCRGAIKRSNKARDFESRGNRQRRSDMQHCKVLSGANNNRKCCF